MESHHVRKGTKENIPYNMVKGSADSTQKSHFTSWPNGSALFENFEEIVAKEASE